MKRSVAPVEAPAEEDDEQDGADGSAGGSTAASALFGGVTGAEVAETEQQEGVVAGDDRYHRT